MAAEVLPRWVTPLALGVLLTICATRPVCGIEIVLDFTMDEKNENWFGGTPTGLARRAAVESAASFLSAIITNDDWNSLPSFNGSLGFTDIAASSLVDLSGNPIAGTMESDGQGYEYDIPVTNRSSVEANQYIIYVGAFQFDAGATGHAKGGWDGSNRRNAAGLALTEFNTWGGRIYFDTVENWYAGQNPGLDPSDDYGWQDANKMPTTDISADYWDWNTSTHVWKGYELFKNDPAASGRPDLYATSVHEMIHVLGATSTNFPIYIGLNANQELTGSNLTSVYGGNVPTSGGHFASDVQSTVWNSDGIVSEVSLDPSSLDGRRKYLTDLDAALLRDLGYNLVDGFASADFDYDTFVDDLDLLTWESAYGVDDSADADGDGDSDGDDFLLWQAQYTGSGGQLAPTIIPEPSASLLALLLVGLIIIRPWRRQEIPRRSHAFPGERLPPRRACHESEISSLRHCA